MDWKLEVSKECEDCQGTGRDPYVWRDGRISTFRCRHCNGSGKIHKLVSVAELAVWVKTKGWKLRGD